MPIDKEIVTSKIYEARNAMEEVARICKTPFPKLSIDMVYSMRYNLVVLVESIASLCSHIAVRAYNVTPSSYRDAVRIVGGRIGLNIGCIREVELLIGLRNLLIHRYWVIDDSKVYNMVKENFRCVEKLLEKIREAYL